MTLIKSVDFFQIDSDANYGTTAAYYAAGFNSFLWQKNGSESWVNTLHGLGFTTVNGNAKGFYLTIRDIDVENLDDVNNPGGSAVSANGRNNNITLGDETIGWQIATDAISGYPNCSEWILRDTNGDALIKADDSRKVLMDVGNADYRAWFAARLLSYFNATGDFSGETSNFGGANPVTRMDFLWLDNGNADNCGRCRVSGTAYDIVDQVVTPAAYDGDYAAWEAANIGFYQYVRRYVCDVIESTYSRTFGLQINLQGSVLADWKTHAGTVRSDDASKLVFDGMLIEFGPTASDEGHYSEADWLLNINKMQYAEGNGQEIWYVGQGEADQKVGETGATRTWHDHYGFSLASYLMGWSNRAKFRYTWSGYDVAYTETAEYELLEALLGYPTGPMQATGTTGSQTFTRAFERGTVTVIPSANTEGSTTTANTSFKILIDNVYLENTGGSAEVGDAVEGGTTYTENSSGTPATEFTGTVASYVSYAPAIGVSIPRWLMPDAVHGTSIRVSATDGGSPVELYTAQWDVTVTAGDYILVVSANHSGATGSAGQRVYGFYLDGTQVIDAFDPVADEAAQQAAFAWGQATIADTTATVTWEKQGSFSGEVSAIGLYGPIADSGVIVNAINDQADSGGDVVYIPVIASNPSGNGTLTYSIADGPSGITFTNNILSGTLAYHASETTYTDVTVTVSNGTDSTDVLFDWVVSAGGTAPGSGGSTAGRPALTALIGPRLLRGGIR